MSAKKDKGVEIITPQFDRPAHWPKPTDPPPQGDMKAWAALHSLTREECKARGMTRWEKGIYLFPCEWYDSVPEGLDVVFITGIRKRFYRAQVSNDRRMGCLPFGVYASDGWKDKD